MGHVAGLPGLRWRERSHGAVAPLAKAQARRIERLAEIETHPHGDAQAILDHPGRAGRDRDNSRGDGPSEVIGGLQ
jgi:hypothetical protein